MFDNDITCLRSRRRGIVYYNNESRRRARAKINNIIIIHLSYQK